MFSAAKNLLIAESNPIKQFSENLDENFQRAVEVLLNHRGKTIVCGMGKSGHLAKKIAVAFTSIGQSSVFCIQQKEHMEIWQFIPQAIRHI
jgi:arabinose-5-phosphate isomerase